MMEANRRSGGRQRDTFVDPHLLSVEEGNAIARTCRYCGHRFSIQTSVTRIKAHLGGVFGHGVALCLKVPPDVRERAFTLCPKLKAGPSISNIPHHLSQTHTQQPRPSTPHQPQPTEAELQAMERWLLSSPQDDRCHSGHDITLHGLSRSDDSVNVSEDLEGLELAPDFLNPSTEAQQTHQHQNSLNESRSKHGVLTSRHPTQQHLGEVPNCLPCEDVQQNAMMRDTMLDASIPQDLLQEHPMQHHLGEVPYCWPYEDEQQDAAMMDSMLDASLSQDFLQGGDYPNSLPHSAHQEDVPIAEFNNHGGLESQHHMQENLQGDQRVNSLEHDLYPSIEPQLHHMRIDPVLEKKRKLLDKAPPSGKKLPMETKFRGPTFNRKVDEIYASLQDDSVNRIGVYGMGGSGKTTVMKHIHNLLLKDNSMPFTHVIWATVSKDHTYPKLQRHVASKCNIILAHDEDQVAWAAALCEKMQDMCYALILDDVWDVISFEDLGIPEPSQENKCKLILTTRSRNVCYGMKCKPHVFLDCLSQEEAWELFVETLNDTPKDSNIQGIMKKVAEECACLPLAIVTVAGSMRGKIKVYQWENALDTLRREAHGFTNMDEKVIVKLKFSYDRLSLQLQQCLLSCALYPEDYQISRQELIEMWINEGTIGSTKSLSSEYNYGLTVINELENACLLMPDDFDCVVMHDLIRDMCLVIAGGQFLVKCGSEHPPNESEYTEDVEKVSLVWSYFKEIPSHMVPHCPKLSTLLLSGNRQLTRIADSFFMNLPRLKVLNLSRTSIEELPNSVTNLVSLSALVLRDCRNLKRLPCLAPLEALYKLDLSWSGIEEAPEGLGELVNLTYLDLQATAIRTLPSSTLGNLVKLQYLKTGRARIMMDDVKELKELETFQAEFANLEEYREYVNSMPDNGRGPSQYDVVAFCQFKPYGLRRYACDGIVKADLRLKRDERSRGDNCLSDEVIEIIIPSLEIVDTLEVEEIGGNHFVISEVEREVSSTRLHIKQQTEESGELKCLFDAKLLLAFPNLRRLEVGKCDLIE